MRLLEIPVCPCIRLLPDRDVEFTYKRIKGIAGEGKGGREGGREFPPSLLADKDKGARYVK